MSMNGGYKIIDFKDQNITTENGITVIGIYESIEGSHRKALMVSGLVIDGVEKNDCFVDCTAAENSFAFTAYGHTITVHNDDTVTLT